MKIVLCDSNTVNSYGFKTDVNGIDLTRFKKNPVMLYNHDPERVIGRWEDIAVEQTDGRPSQLTATPVFDMEDPFAAEIARKVEDGFIKGCSMGIMIKEMTRSKGIDTATSSVLLEASIVSIPADENALVVYADADKKQQLSINDFNKLFYEMETQKETAAQAQDIAQLQAQIEERDCTIADLTAQVYSLKKDLAEREYHDADDFAQQAVDNGKIPAELKGDITAMYLENKERTTRLMAAIRGNDPAPTAEPAGVTLSSLVKKGGDATNGATWDDLDKTPGALKNLQASNPEEFKRLYREKFGTEWNW